MGFQQLLSAAAALSSLEREASLAPLPGQQEANDATTVPPQGAENPLAC